MLRVSAASDGYLLVGPPDGGGGAAAAAAASLADLFAAIRLSCEHIGDGARQVLALVFLALRGEFFVTGVDSFSH